MTQWFRVFSGVSGSTRQTLTRSCADNVKSTALNIVMAFSNALYISSIRQAAAAAENSDMPALLEQLSATRGVLHSCPS